MNFTTSRMVIDESQGKESNRSFGVMTEKEALYIFKKTVDDTLTTILVRAIKMQMIQWLKKHNMYLFEHTIKAMNVEFSRLGYLQGRHYIETY